MRRHRGGTLATLIALALICVLPATALAVSVTYRLEVVNTWSTTTHPGAFPQDPHFSWLGGGTHSDRVSFWSVGELASPGMEQMAETGVTTMLLGEVQTAVGAGDAFAPVEWRQWFCPSEVTHLSCGSLVVEFEVDENFPLVTLVSMLGPTPDWFVGTDALNLRPGGSWVPSLETTLFPYDGGTISTNAFELGGDPSLEPITLITDDTGQLIGGQSLGAFRFTLVPEPGTALLTAFGVGVLALRRRSRGWRRFKNF
jgi:hypothetical protein